MRGFLLSSSLLFSSAGVLVHAQVNYAKDLVNPFIGTGGHGHTFPGACVPNGLVQLSPDTRTDGYNDWDGCGGYHYSDSIIYGFSHTHLSGTGVADLCDVLLMPMSTAPSTDPAVYRSAFQHTTEVATAGYYKVHLQDELIDAELTASPRCGVHRYTFPTGAAPSLVLDLEHRDKLTAGHIELVNPNEVVGWRRSSSWARDQQLYYCIRFSQACTDIPDKPSGAGIEQVEGRVTKRIFRFAPNTAPLIVTVGISAVSVDGARRNLQAEVPLSDFDRVRQQAEDAWNAKLSKIEVTGGTKEQQRIFYTALYHCYVAPYVFNDVDGNYRGMDGQVHHADHNVYTVFSLWDTFRALHPLMTILEPEMTSDFIKTFLLHYQQGGKLPVWELWGNETDCMIGYHSVSVIADAYSKGIRGFDAELALEAMVASANRDEPGLNAYRKNGYISSEDQSESVSKTLEYAYDDWCILAMAAELGHDSLADVFRERSRNWQNLLDPETKFFRAKRNGGFITPFDPYEVNFNFTEANAWQYSMFVPHQMAQFKDYLGGSDSLASKLDRLFTAKRGTSGREQADITGLIGQYAHGNEPSHQMAYLYSECELGEFTLQRRVPEIMNTMYHDRPDGLAGNEDCGQMSAWLVFSAMGFYPNPPFDDYTFGAPWFDHITINSGLRPFVIKPEGASGHGPLVLSRRLNGSTLKNWEGLSHRSIVSGDSLIQEFGERAPDGRMYEVISGWSSTPQPLPVPIISAGSRTFTDSLIVDITCLPGPWRLVRVPVSGPEILSLGRSAMKGIVLINSDVVRAYTTDSLGRRSPIVTAHFTKIDGTRTIKLDSPYANQYAAGGDNALIDGQRGGKDFRTGEWQGTQGEDVVATIDLGSVQKLQRVGLSVLQDAGSWIWFPAEVTFAWSTNGRNWSSETVNNAVDRKADGGLTQELWTETLGKKARYIKVIAKNAGPCPVWHPGKGGTTWIFADEILIEAE